MTSTAAYNSESENRNGEITDDAAVQHSPSATSSDGWASSAEILRPADTAPLLSPSLTWDKAVAKGDRLLELMQNPGPIPHSSFAVSALAQWGYTSSTHPITPVHHQYALLCNIVPGSDPDAVEVKSSHIQTTVMSNGILIPATDAFFTNVFDLRSGTIIADVNFKPEYTYPALQDGEAYPALKHWSDITALQAQQAIAEANTHPNNKTNTDTLSPTPFPNLTHIIRSSIENTHANHIIHQLIQHHTSPCSYPVVDTGCPQCCRHIAWPGWTFESDTEAARALLGTPNGAGVAWLLGQHEALFGRRTVARMTLWCELKALPERPSLLFHVRGQEEEGFSLEGFLRFCEE
ncbi:hypothetical protein EJ07DRAFT_152443 [Lizonia empirigonia]|nr:hypothetical protein EJ07DRAFT_152443 [Lizonia empirigonia]